MKSTSLSKIFKHSLQDELNFNDELNVSPQDVIENYKELILEYYKFVNENIKIQKREYYEYIMNRGLDTITHVFITILYCTKNQEIVYYYAQKSIYLYVEFVNQISEIDKHFLQLTSRDATIYVYKKTIFDLNIESRKKGDIGSNETKDKLNTIANNINIIKSVFTKLIQQWYQPWDHNNELFVSTINSFQSQSKDIETMNNLKALIDALFYNVTDNIKFAELIRCLNMNTTTAKKMKPVVINDDFFCHLQEPAEVFIQWLFE